MTPNRARARLACKIAGVDPDRFNEAIHAGHYPCAPETTPGSARIFDIEDMVALMVYGRLLERGVPPRNAGQTACGIHSVLREFPGTERVVQFVAAIGATRYSPAEHFDWAATHHGGLEVVEVCEFRLRWYREQIEQELIDAARIVGED